LLLPQGLPYPAGAPIDFLFPQFFFYALLYAFFFNSSKQDLKQQWAFFLFLTIEKKIASLLAFKERYPINLK